MTTPHDHYPYPSSDTGTTRRAAWVAIPTIVVALVLIWAIMLWLDL